MRAAERLARQQQEEIKQLRAKLRTAERAADRTAPWIEQQRVSGEEAVVRRVKELRRKGKDAAEARREADAAQAEAAERRAEAEAMRKELNQTNSKVTTLERSYEKLQSKFNNATLHNQQWAKDKDLSKRETQRADAQELLAAATQLQLQETEAQLHAALARVEEAEFIRNETLTAAGRSGSGRRPRLTHVMSSSLAWAWTRGTQQCLSDSTLERLKLVRGYGLAAV